MRTSTRTDPAPLITAPGLERALDALGAARAATDADARAAALVLAEATLRAAQAALGTERDLLTGLPARAAFVTELERFLSEARRHGRDGVLVLVDIDGLSMVNDRHDRPAGDRLLTATAALLASRLRTEDGLARVGDGTFAVLLRGTTLAPALGVADDLRARIAAASAEAGTPVTATAGLAALDATTADAAAAVHAAETALRSAKASGRDRSCAARAGMPEVPPAHEPVPAPDRLLVELSSLAATPTVDGALAAVRELLGMDISYVTRHTDEEQVFVRLAGDGESFGVGEETRLPLEATYCEHILQGRLPSLMTDLTEHPAAMEMPVTEGAGVRAYASVPVRLSDGRLFGTLCCANHEPLPRLGERDIRFLQVLARLVAHEIERDGYLREQEELRLQAAGSEVLLRAIESRDAYTYEHSRVVVDLAVRVAERLGLDETAVKEVAQVALLHDIGKIATPDAILHKPGPLDAEEEAEMRRHPERGAWIVAAVPQLAHLAPAIRAEHERYDGGGYPDGLAGEDIPIAARITLVCDAFHAMTSDRPYRARLDRADAVAELNAHAGTQFCAVCVQALLAILAGRDSPV